ncbi:MAG: Asp-tRNA(Asn)/Glu-tRNA(Gln) amidotransferase subunit GatB [Candidatus Komeilibacteria bacterium]
MSKYEPVIGLEIHLQLKTKSKMFCRCANERDNQQPNSAVCPVCLGHPGTLPVVNAEAIRQGIRLGLGINCYINRFSKFDRKNYFYPDLPKGYQITQFDQPLATDGYLLLLIGGQERRFSIERMHLEEDTGKNFHIKDQTLIDFNRAGAPLGEIVTKPDFRSPQEAKRFLQELKLIARYLGVSDADMEKGQLRVDVNISLRPVGDVKLYPKTEVKNVNSFRSVERALQYEIERQTKLWQGEMPPQQGSTRGWDDSREITVEQRVKEESNDYRFFPEPDLPPLELSVEEVEEIKKSLPELPLAKRHRFQEEFLLNYGEAEVLSMDIATANYFEATVSELRAWLLSSGETSGSEEEIWAANRKKLARLALAWITTELFKHLNAGNKTIEQSPVTPEDMTEFIVLVYQGKVNSSAAQTIFATMVTTGEDPQAIADRLDLHQESNEESLSEIVRTIIENNPDQVNDYRSGKQAIMKYFVGLAMKESKGRGNPQVLEKLFKEELEIRQ